MEIKRKPTALILAVAYGAWELLLKPIWTLNVERFAEKEKIDTALSGGGPLIETLRPIVAYVPSSFGLGFVLGALLFAYWDWIVAAFGRLVLRKEPESGLRAWVGTIMPYLELKERGGIQLRITALNIGKEAFKVQAVEGHITLSLVRAVGRKEGVDLPAPTLSGDAHKEVPPGHILNLYLHQPIPEKIAAEMPATFTWEPFPSFSFENLVITISTVDGKHQRRLKLWESLRMSAGDDRIRAEQTFSLFKSDEQRDAFQKSMLKVATMFGRRA